MGEGTYMVKFPKLCRGRVGRDLADHGPDLGSSRPGFYEGLRPEPLAARVRAWQDDLATGDPSADPDDDEEYLRLKEEHRRRNG